MGRSHGESHAEARAAAPFTPGGPQGPGRGPAPGAPNAGRPKDSVRQAALLAFEERVKILCDIADGLLTTTALVRQGKDQVAVEIGPSIEERRKAVCDLGRFGGVEKIELSQDGDEEMDTRTRYGIILMPPPLPKPVPPAGGSSWSPAPGSPA